MRAREPAAWRRSPRAANPGAWSALGVRCPARQRRGGGSLADPVRCAHGLPYPDQENLARLHRLITHERAGALAHELLEHYAVGRKRPGLRGLEEDANEALLAAIEPEIVDAHHIATRNTPEAFALARDTLERSWTRPGHAERLKRIVDQTFPAYSKQRARARLQAAQKYLATTGGRNPGRDPPRER